MEIRSSKLIVVLGMHRSGTSATTRGLEVLGVKLGDNLHPAAIDNPKGFWEDRDFLSINEELLAYLGSGSERLGLIDWKIPKTSAIASLRLKAEKIVREKCDQNPLWAFKDPRTARLLPFWQSVFEYVDCDVRYVIVNRNPVSIVQSLYERNGFEPEKTFYLWLEHLVPAIARTMGASRVVIDYDRLLENPEQQLLRLANTLGLPAPMPLALSAFETEFLDYGLRHTYFATHDLEFYPSVPSQVITAYEWLVKMSNDDVVLNSAEIDQVFETLSRELIALSPALSLIDRQEQKMVVFSQTKTHRDQTIVDLQAEVKNMISGNAWMTSQRDAWEQATVQRDQTIAALTLQLQKMDESLKLREDMLNKIRSQWFVRFVNIFSRSQF